VLRRRSCPRPRSAPFPYTTLFRSWSSDVSTFIANALSPAKPTNVSLDEVDDQRVATVIVPSDQMSLAIGKEGQNARLAYKLTGRSEEHTSELQSRENLVCRLLLEK